MQLTTQNQKYNNLRRLSYIYVRRFAKISSSQSWQDLKKQYFKVKVSFHHDYANSQGLSETEAWSGRIHILLVAGHVGSIASIDGFCPRPKFLSSCY